LYALSIIWLALASRNDHLEADGDAAANPKWRLEMRDEIDSRLWLEHGAAFTEDLAKLFRQAGEAINRLNEVQFRAPWRREAGYRS
jgi:hypothetical protein